PPVVTINQGSTFMVTAPDGQMLADSDHGVFADDTRFVSVFAVFANGESWKLLTSSPITYYAARFHLTNPLFETEDGPVNAGTLGLSVVRNVADGIHEDIDLTNYGRSPVRFNLEVALRSDFADLFEVKSRRFIRRGRITTEWNEAGAQLETSYTNRDFTRRFIYRLSQTTSPAAYANGRISFEIALQPGGRWHACCSYVLVRDDRIREPLRGCTPDQETGLDALQRQWLEQATTLTSANEDVYRLYRQSVEDMGALRLHEHDVASDLWMPAAGVPWFVTIFGRDSLIASLQNMIVFPRFASGVLKKLAEHQATQIDDWRDAEPGKILHEIRFGELAHFKRIPHTPYYGTADATPLYLIVLHEAWKWLGDLTIVREHRDAALRCLEWIDRYGDIDGDGFQEYQTRSSAGYENMSWKDAGDAVMYPDGTQVRQPKALCELQGYVFDAWMRMSELFDALDEADRAQELRRRAADLQQRFEERFWCEDIGCYAFALDSNKQPVRTIASNVGHCLWSGLIRPDRAARVVERLMRPDMWSGWGIRTLSRENPAYNPSSYQCGSVWPHDNGIIALGFKRYGFAREAARIARDISEAASYFVSYRLPELYAGLERRPGTFPVQYPGANVPQA
ncbi:MAG TPA: glycogen debranching N-terminal domain-containing protein, partial [Vicinamibacterales bacterium]|nr:glycogen debranching N-terminal domain-containing protein [Vicinamibacterales bacterium]